MAALATEPDDDGDYIPFEKGMQINTAEKPEAVQLDDKFAVAFEPLVKMNVLEIGIGLGFSYQLLTTDLEGMNFASSRANKISDSRFFRSMYRWFAKCVCQAHWKRFVEWEIMSGRIPGVSYSQYVADSWMWNECFWLPEGEDWVDPLKDAETMKLLYLMGMATLQELCAAKGKDYKAVRDQAAERGTIAHYLIECDIKNEKPDISSYAPMDVERAETAYLAWLDWCKSRKLETVASELPIVSEICRAGGTVDWLVRHDGELWLVDHKTSKGIFPEMVYQVAAYTKMAAENGYKIKDTHILRLDRDTGAFEDYQIKEADIERGFRVFQLCREIYELQKKVK
jgi:hypothetical protein